MASPFPAKSHPLHNFTLPHLRWNKDGQSSGPHPHPHRRRTVKSPSRRTTTSSASPSPIRHSPFRDSVSSTPPRYQSPLHDPPEAAPSPPRKSSTAGESYKSYPIGGGGDRLRNSSRPNLAPAAEGLGKAKVPLIEHRRKHPKNSTSDNPTNYAQTQTAQKFEPKSRAKEVDSTGIKKSKILIKIPPLKKSKPVVEDPQEETPKIEKNAEIEETEQMREEGKINNPTDEEIKIWNLRPRKPLRKSLNVNGVTAVKTNGSAIVIPEKSKSDSPLLNPNSRSVENKGNSGEKKEKRKLSVFVSLSKEEIEEDIFALTGSKPARRPKKRAKIVQKQVDSICPGSWLVSITADSYKVSENSLKG